MPAAFRTRAVRRLLSVSFVMATLVVALTGFALASYADETVQARVSISFPFVAGGKDLPAGTYEFSLVPGRVVLRSKDRNIPQVTMVVVTRLGRHGADTNRTELIFDKGEGNSILSELWIPGSDGYLLVHGTPDHEHEVVGGSGPTKR